MEEKIKEYQASCKICGGNYKLQGTKEQLENYLSIFGFVCEAGRHTELGTIGQYLEIISESDELSSLPKIEPRKPDEYLACELPEGLGI